MIIYKDLLTDEEIISDTFKLIDVGDVLWEADLRMITKGPENIELSGANPSAEGEDADEGGENETVRVLDIVDQFRLTQVEGLDKKAYTGDLKKYMKNLTEKMKEKGTDEAEIKKFQKGAQEAAKNILGNFKNYDIYQGGESYGEGMYVLVDFREDGVTPYATVWKHGLSEMKV